MLKSRKGKTKEKKSDSITLMNDTLLAIGVEIE